MRRAWSVFAALTLSITLGGCTAISRQTSAWVHGPEPAPRGDLKALYGKDVRLGALWIGHATVLIRMDDRYVLTDPVFENEVGALARRLVLPGIPVEAVPNGVTVLISHAHFDHLAVGSLTDLAPKIRHAYFPVGGVSYLPDMPMDARELPAWDTEDDLGLRVTAVPVVHRSGRYGLDAAWNDATFTGYVVEYHGMRVYFGGDTAYEPSIFTKVKENFDTIDLAILPIGPIHPREFMRSMHEDGYEALNAFSDLGAQYMLPIHFGTFVNSTDDDGEDVERFRGGVVLQHVEPERAQVLVQGQTRVYLKKQDEQAPEKKPALDVGDSDPVAK